MAVMSDFNLVVDYFEAHPSELELGCTRAERRETHISVVLLTTSYAFKFKKPVSLGFIDQTSLAARLENCHREISLNSRLSSGVYLGTRGVHGKNASFSLSSVLENAREYCVQMKRLNEADNLMGRLKHGSLSRIDCDHIALQLSRFHAALRANSGAARLYQFEKNLTDNIDALRQSGRSDDLLLENIMELFRSAKLKLRRRLQQGRIVDGHGDLRLEHVFLHDGQSNIIDCVEFNAAIRSVDPLEDIAFLSLGFRMEDRGDLADGFLNAYYSYSLDPHPELMPLFEIYRATVRMKIDLIQLTGTTNADRITYLNRRFEKYTRLIAIILKKQHHAGRQPVALTLLIGPPLSGKSTRARELGQSEGAVIFSTDVVRKRMFKKDIFEHISAEFSASFFAPRLKVRVYRYVYALAKHYLQQGFSIILDGTFSRKAEREHFAILARTLGIKLRVEMLDIDEATAVQRIEARKRADSVSDLKDIETWKKVRSEFEAS